MKIRIITENFDVEKLDSNIERFLMVTDKAPYLFMSKMTANLLMSGICEWDNRIESLKNRSAFICKYKGYKCYENNDIEFGEVELR